MCGSHNSNSNVLLVEVCILACCLYVPYLFSNRMMFAYFNTLGLVKPLDQRVILDISTTRKVLLRGHGQPRQERVSQVTHQKRNRNRYDSVTYLSPLTAQYCFRQCSRTTLAYVSQATDFSVHTQPSRNFLLSSTAIFYT